MTEDRLFPALKVLSSTLRNVKWIIVASASLQLHGVDVVAGDIDILTTKKGALAITNKLKRYQTKPVAFGRSELYESWWGKLKIHGVEVEIIGNLKRNIKGRWVAMTHRLRNPLWIQWNGLRLPVSRLRGQLRTYSRRLRPKDIERTKKIREFLARNKLPTKSWISPKIRIKQSSIAGKGMFARTSIKTGEILVIWGAKYLTKRDAEKVKKNNPKLLVMQWDDDLFSVETRSKDIGYFINHSCDPNMWMKNAITILARRHIKKGEELTSDYALWEARKNYVSKWTCCCGSSLCRKKVTGHDWQSSTLQQRYKNHFAPLINKRIAARKP